MKSLLHHISTGTQTWAPISDPPRPQESAGRRRDHRGHHPRKVARRQGHGDRSLHPKGVEPCRLKIPVGWTTDKRSNSGNDQLHGQRLLSTFVHNCVQGCSRICYRGDPLATRGVRGHDEATAPEEPRRRRPGHPASHWETTALSLGVTDTVVRPLTAGEMNIEIRPHRISLPQRSVDEEDMGAEILASTWTSTCW